jgi:PhnB protein
VRDAAKAIEFYQRAFGAQELFRLTEPGGRIGHAEIKIGTTTLMLSEEYPEMDIVGPKTLGGTTFSIHLHVDNADAWIARAVEAGGTVVRPARDAFYGERSGTVRDPFGHEWLLGHQIEEVSTKEMQSRYTALFNQ